MSRLPLHPLLLSLVLLFAPLLGHAQVKANLLATEQAVQPGRPLTVVLELVHEKGWHTYWEFAGTGYPTSVQWDLPPGWTAGPIQWPVPGLILDRLGGISGQGYDGRTLLPMVLTPPASFGAATEVELKGRAEWLMCHEQCIPGQQDLTLRLPVTSTTPAPRSDVQADLAAQPKPGDGAALNPRAERGPAGVVLSWTTQAAARDVHFLTRDGLTSYEQKQTAQTQGNRSELQLRLAPEYEGEAKWLDGVLRWTTADGQVHGYALRLPLAAAGAASSDGLPLTLFFAFVGGLILNLMPCVFPVLGIKVLGFVNQAGADRRKVTYHGLAFTGGVLLSFWALAGALALLRAGGDQLGWGFQLQSAPFVFGLAVVMLVFGLSMSGVFEFGLSATSVGSDLQMKSGVSGSFFSGVLATVVATPCSAPFLAPVLGTALSLPFAQSFAVFTSIAVGLSTPYLSLSLFPAAVRILPRPGAWMETFKQVMAFPLYATAAYLVWVLAGQVGEKALRDLLLGLVAIALGAWFYGRYTAPGSKPTRARVGFYGGIALMLAGVAFGWPRAETQTWRPWSAEAVAAAQKEGRWVYVDFTARWCATCQTNKALVFSSSDVQQTLKDRNVLLLKGDWTNRDAAITAELARFGRSAVPVTLIYAPGAREPQLLPEILTPSVVLDALKPQS